MASNLTRGDSFGDLIRVPTLSGFDDFFKDLQMWPGARSLMTEPRIKMDVSETDKSYQVKAEIPGVKKEDIKVSVEGNLVSISAEIKNEQEEKDGESVIRSERFYGQKSRSFTLANEIDSAQASAEYHDGVLELTLPKKEGSNGAKHLAIN